MALAANPDCSKHPNGLTADPDDPHKFYKCAHGKVAPPALQCPKDQKTGVQLTYDDTAQACVDRPAIPCPKPNGTFPVEGDKQSFLRCDNGVGVIIKCNPELVFNKKCGYCDWESELDKDCTTKMPTEPNHVTEPARTTAKESTETPKPVECQEKTVEDDSKDDKKYYLCNGGKKVSVTCPEGTKFDKTKNICA